MRYPRTIRAAAVAALVAAFTGPTGRAAPTAGTAGCELPETGRHWLQEALNGWAQIRESALGLPLAPLPWLVLFDEQCVWHLSPDLAIRPELKETVAGLTMNGEPVRVFAGSHTGEILLPDGRVSTARATASTSIYGDGSATFSLVSMFGVWERDPRHARQPQLGEFFQSLLIHELAHSTQMAGVTKRVAELRRSSVMPGTVDDDVVQRRFGFVQSFRSAIDSECSSFYRAVQSADASSRRQWIEKGLGTMRKRRARFYVGHNRVFRELEDVFFAMEGSAQWAAYRWARLRSAPSIGDGEILKFVRADRKYWSQDEGLALYLLVDALVPGWQARTFGDTMVSPFALLEGAVHEMNRVAPR